MRTLKTAVVLACALVPAAAAAQEMTIERYDPRSTLAVPGAEITRAKFPFIDVHSHQRGNASPEAVDAIVREMDAMNMGVMVNLSGRSGEQLAQSVQAFKGRHPKRFVTFANLNFSGIDEPGWGTRAAAQLERDVREGGAQGLKIFKNLGLSVRDANGRVPTDDPRLDPVWAKAGELGVPVLIHTAEPAAFFEPMDEHNERWLELKLHPDRARPPNEYPSWETLMQEQWDVFRKHPRTNFIAAHMAWLGGDLGRLGTLLDEMPNMHVELGAVIAEIGRQPRFAREFFERYQDRILIGKDSWRPAEYRVYFRVLESEDEYFDYYRNYHAFWKMYGLGLSDEVLKKVYYKNALAIIPDIDASGFPD